MLAFMIQCMQLARIEEYACLLITNKGIIFPRIPQTAHNLQMLFRNPIALIMGIMLIPAVIARSAFQPRRHHIPTGTPAANMVQ
ncbi:hypothetical protein D3C86_2145710 [compost metagenome]